VCRSAYLAQLLKSADAATHLDDGIPERQEFPMLAVPKPRMSVRDKFALRRCVQRYFAFGDELRLRGAKLPMNYRIEFHFPMPDSWPEIVKAQMNGKPKLTRPDGSNLIKAVEDHLVPKDETLFKGTFEKYWSRTLRIVITKGQP
jgi:Holliday junction resolvase RusA-like endonuclease